MSGVEHDVRCEREYTESGYVFIDCLCHIRRAKAEAWDEGRAAGSRDVATRADDWTPNPYRAAQVAPSRDGLSPGAMHAPGCNVEHTDAGGCRHDASAGGGDGS